jgi:hypothetical protein
MKRIPLFVDFLFVLLFVTIGRTAHHHSFSLAGLASTLWPFAAGLGCGWSLVTLRGHAGLALDDGSLIVVVTVAVGMVLRVVAGQGTAFAFVIVALAFLGLFLVGWRVLFRFARRRRHRGVA